MPSVSSHPGFVTDRMGPSEPANTIGSLRLPIAQVRRRSTACQPALHASRRPAPPACGRETRCGSRIVRVYRMDVTTKHNLTRAGGEPQQIGSLSHGESFRPRRGLPYWRRQSTLPYNGTSGESPSFRPAAFDSPRPPPEIRIRNVGCPSRLGNHSRLKWNGGEKSKGTKTPTNGLENRPDGRGSDAP